MRASSVFPRIFIWAFLPVFASTVHGQSNPPPDKPVRMSDQEGVKRLDTAIAPYVKKARATLPAVKKRYLRGLPEGDDFEVTIRLFDPDGKFEQVFVKVNSWSGRTITGAVNSHVELLRSHKNGENVTCDERDILDWVIEKPDGSEEGNFVGKFLDTYKP